MFRGGNDISDLLCKDPQDLFRVFTKTEECRAAEFSDWLQRHMLPNTLQSGKLSVDAALEISRSLICNYERSAKAWTATKRPRELVDLSFEFGTDCRSDLVMTSYYDTSAYEQSKKTGLDAEGCPVCNPSLMLGDRHMIVKPIRLVKRNVRFSDNGSIPVSRSFIEFLSAAEHDQEPEFIEHYCASVSRQMVCSFDVGARRFDLYVAMPKSGNATDFSLERATIHRVRMYRKPEDISQYLRDVE